MSKIKTKIDVVYSVRITAELEQNLLRIAEIEGRSKTNTLRHYLEVGLKTAKAYKEPPCLEETPSSTDSQRDIFEPSVTSVSN